MSGMGKEQELLESARTGNVGLVEKLLSGKKGLLGSGSGSIPLPGLLRYGNVVSLCICPKMCLDERVSGKLWRLCCLYE